MKTLNNRILENLIWIREMLIAKGKDTTKIDAQIETKRKEIAANVKLSDVERREEKL
jgi:hypothetical protein